MTTFTCLLKDFFKGIKGARYSHYGQNISGHTDSFEELLTVLDRHAQGQGHSWRRRIEELICFVTTEEGPIVLLSTLFLPRG